MGQQSSLESLKHANIATSMRIFYYIPAIFAVMNLYIFWRMRTGFGPGKWQWAVLFLMAGMIWLFMQRRSLMGSPWETPLHTISLIWVGFVLITLTWVFFLDCARILAWGMDYVAGTQLGLLLRPSRSVPFVLGLSLLLGVYALVEAVFIHKEHLTIATEKLPSGTRLRIAVMTDVHVNSLIGVTWRVKRMARAANETKADILLMLGDLADTDMRSKTVEAEVLRSISAPLGKFAVLGNHEAYSGLENALRFTRDAGFTVLRSEIARAGGITLVGVDDPMFIAGRGKNATAAEEEICLALLHSLNTDQRSDEFILLLRHRPGTHKSIAGLFDLQLSGHTHGGQIWPAKIFTKWANGFSNGLATVQGDNGQSVLYVSRGTGVWGPPMRLFTPPEITVVDLVGSPR